MPKRLVFGSKNSKPIYVNTPKFSDGQQVRILKSTAGRKRTMRDDLEEDRSMRNDETSETRRSSNLDGDAIKRRRLDNC